MEKHPNRVDGHLNSAVVFQSSAAVGLIVMDTPKAGADPVYTGGFFTPEEAREIAAKLVVAADAAEADRARPVPTLADLVAAWRIGPSA